MLPPRPTTREMTGGYGGPEVFTHTSNTGPQEAVQPSRAQSSNYAEQVQAYRDAQKQADHSSKPGVNFSAGRTKSGDGSGVRKALVVLPAVASLILLGAVIMFATNAANFSAMMPWSKPATTTNNNDTQQSEDLEELIKAGKFAKALTVLKSAKQQGNLTPEAQEKYELCCVSVAKQYMKEKKFSEAITLLKEVPAKSGQSKQAKDLLKKAKRGQVK
ncbi:MAG: tetratricopeptide repeat protein [Candidatus Competibacteraceae bacterium]|nr:tetratricopeptide repeat protein [Candidatus Competibacteraceae bacterium]